MLLDRLGKIHQRIPDMLALSLIDRDGISVESIAMHPGLDLEGLAVEMLTRLREIHQSFRELDGGPMSQLTVSSGDRSIVLSCLPSEFFLLLVLSRGGNLGRARFELQRAGLLLESELS